MVLEALGMTQSHVWGCFSEQRGSLSSQLSLVGLGLDPLCCAKESPASGPHLHPALGGSLLGGPTHQPQAPTQGEPQCRGEGV